MGRLVRASGREMGLGMMKKWHVGGCDRDLIRQSISETPSLMRFPALQVGPGGKDISHILPTR